MGFGDKQLKYTLNSPDHEDVLPNWFLTKAGVSDSTKEFLYYTEQPPGPSALAISRMMQPGYRINASLLV